MEEMLLIGVFLAFLQLAASEKCYSCSSAQMSLRWPKDEDNQLLYFHDFPFFANNSCDMVKGALPVVDCPDDVCIKAVINEEPAKREVCAEGGAIVRDCWGRVIKFFNSDKILSPKARPNQVRLTDDVQFGRTIGVVYTCEGYLCNAAPIFTFIPVLLLLILTAFRL